MLSFLQLERNIRTYDTKEVDFKAFLTEVKTDVRLLLESLKYQSDNPHAVKQALLTLVSIFSSHDSPIKDHFRDIGGLHFVLSLLTSTTNTEVKEVALYCLGCAVESNVFSQKHLTKESIFGFLRTTLSSESCTTRLKQTASFFLISLVSNNVVGQNLARKSFCLMELLKLLRTTLPQHGPSNALEKESWFEDVGTTCLELWSSVSSALCICMNNPQNEENQRLCGLELPYMFTVMLQHNQPGVLNPLLSLIGFTVANNKKNQERVRRCGGLQVLCTRLYHAVESNTKHSLQLAVHIISALDTCIADDKENAEEVGDLSAMADLMNVLSNSGLDVSDRIKVIVTIGHSVELSVKAKEDLIKQHNGLECLIQQMSVSDDEEFCRAVKYVLQLCVEQDSDEREVTNNTSGDDHRREEGLMLLKKIEEISDRLKNIEEETSVNYKAISDMMSPRNKQGSSGISLHREPSLQKSQRQVIVDANNNTVSRPFEVPAGNFVKCSEMQPANNQLGMKIGMEKCLMKEQCSVQGDIGTSYLEAGRLGKGCLTKDIISYPDHRGSHLQQMKSSEDFIHTEQFHTPVSQIVSNKGDATPGCPIKNWNIHNQQVLDYQNHLHHCTQLIHCAKSKKELFHDPLVICSGKEGFDQNHNHFDTCYHVNCHQTCTPMSRGQKMVLLSQYKGDEKVHYPQLHVSDLPQCEKSSQDRCRHYKPSYEDNLHESCPEKERSDMEIDDHVLKGTPRHGNLGEKGISSFDKSVEDQAHTNRKIQTHGSVKVDRSVEIFKKPTTAPNRTKKVHSTLSVRRCKPLWYTRRMPNTPGGTLTDEIDNYASDTCSEAPSEFDCGLMHEAKQDPCNPRLHRMSERNYSVSTPLQRGHVKLTPRVEVTTHIFSGKVNVPALVSCGTGNNHLCDKNLSKEKPVNDCLTRLGHAMRKESTDISEQNDDQSDSDVSSTETSSVSTISPGKDNQQRKSTANKCIGCTGAVVVGDTRLNSRTLNILLETNPYTCKLHRDVRNLERDYISKLRRQRKVSRCSRSYLRAARSTKETPTPKADKDVYEMTSDSDRAVSPPRSVLKRHKQMGHTEKASRKGRVPYSEEEIQNLMEGVKTMGKFWSQILVTFKFHPSRTAVHLKDKYRQLQKMENAECKSSTSKARPHKPFSMCEERRVLKGVKAFGYNWQTILQTYKFAKGRTNEDLRNKWRCMNRRKNFSS